MQKSHTIKTDKQKKQDFQHGIIGESRKKKVMMKHFEKRNEEKAEDKKWNTDKQRGQNLH